MRIAEIVRRVAAPTGALLGAAAICVACSSSTSGSPASHSPAGNLSLGSQPAPSLSLPSISARPSISDLPSISALPSISDLPSVGGDQANTAFCKDFTSFDPSSIGSPAASLKLFDKIAADAPSAIRSDAEKVRDAIHRAVGGDRSGMQSFQTALSKLTTYFTAHCAG